MSIKSFVIALVLVFIIYEVLSITIGVIRNKKQSKNIKESEDNSDVSSEK